ncbi:nitrite reductase [NAD(P)H] large subunit [Photobacterium aphoticum]|uniref:Nitrite reductase [NAD(P)H] large subunit n=1 Tax=Photobacterium aphoticum TaxID=754436 RepID=A0A090QSD1_9GAMM|nr:nitrite reductase [NAD(P)H] large subunit [Photobacterium aphoticum]
MADGKTYQQQGVTYYLNERVVEIDHTHQQVVAASGLRVCYDKLVLATGSYPFVPPIPGGDQPHCHVYRTIDDLDAIDASGQCSDVGVVIGGGLLGLEAANALTAMGLTTHVVEFAPRLMAVQLDDGGGERLAQKITALGVHVHTDKATTAIESGQHCRYRMQFADGSHLETDMIVFSAGIRPNDQLAREAGMAVGERGGIAIDDYCQTSLANVYAIGECASWQGQIFGWWRRVIRWQKCWPNTSSRCLSQVAMSLNSHQALRGLLVQI